MLEPRGRSTALWLVAGILLALKLCYALVVPPNIDEAYYFVWGLVPQASYLDHAPMVGWSSGLARLLAGLSPFAVHLPALATFATIAFALHRWNRATGGGRFAAMLAVLCASPLLNILTTLNYPDHLLICFGLLATLSLARFLDGFGAGTHRWRDLYFGAIWLGLAGLSKYSAVALGLALVLTIVTVPRLRPLLRAPQLYLAGLVTLLLVSPVIWWNIEHHFASVALHTGERYRAETGFGVADTFRLLWQSVLFLSPALAIALWRFLRGARGTETTALTHLGRYTLLLIGLVMFGLSTWSGAEGQVKPHWLAIGFVPFLPVMADAIGRGWLRRLHLGFGLVVMAALTLYYVAAPLSYSWAVAKDGEAAVTFGLEQVVAAAEAQSAATGATAFLFKNYWTAAKFTAARGSIAGTVTISPIPDQFQLWTPPASLAGRDAIIVLAPGDKPDAFAPHFDSLTELSPVTTTRFGQKLATWRLFLGKGWKG
jgi:4-amino-4-deoxy-L-arabinose transferase-like glycosyltransferase